MHRMMPVGPLMIEHRLIERMIGVMRKEAERIGAGGAPDADFVDSAVDFIRDYADGCHHGKEEDILFRELAKKVLSPEDDRMMQELIAEHATGRDVTRRMVEANEKYRAGDNSAIAVLVECMNTLGGFYPRHIEKEDRHFFQRAMRYFSTQERDAMLDEELEFDRALFHARYETIVQNAEVRVSGSAAGEHADDRNRHARDSFAAKKAG